MKNDDSYVLEQEKVEGAPEAWCFKLRTSRYPSIEDVENAYVLASLQACMGNKTLAAQRMGIDRRTFYRKLERMGYKVVNRVEKVET